MPSASVVLLLAVCLSVGCNNVESDRPASQLAVRQLSIEVDVSARSHFLSIIKDVAIREQFQYRIAPVSPDNEYWVIEMAKPEFRVIVANDLNSGTFDVSLYENTINPFPAAGADGFLARLRQAVNGVAGVRLSEPPTVK